jgi:hypothetical protein
MAKEGEEVFLEVGALSPALGALEVDSFELGLAFCASHEIARDGAVEVVHGALDRGDGDSVAAGAVPSLSPSSNWQGGGRGQGIGE